jgi:nascent polypeptide-associated complex subunit alpha
LNRAEKKARKALSKLGLKKVEGVYRVTMKKSRQYLFGFNKPEVFRLPGSDTYVIFGQASIEDLSAQQAAAAADSFKQASAASSFAGARTTGVAAATPEPEVEPEAEEAVDETGLEAKDIELVISQANVSRSKAVTALRNNDGDIVNAIMELTM